MFNREGRPCFALGMVACLTIAVLFLPTAKSARAGSEDGKPGAEEAKPTDFKKLKNPIPNTRKSIARGRSRFVRMCAECHGPDGKAEIDIVANATNLTLPKLWWNGYAEGEIFRSIRDGAGVSMPPYKMQIRREEDMWHLVNFIRSLWPKPMRPKLQDEKAIKETGSSEAKPAEDGGDTHE